MTFGELCVLEPRLRELEADAKASAGQREGARWQAWGGVRRRLSLLVGYLREVPGVPEPTRPAAKVSLAATAEDMVSRWPAHAKLRSAGYLALSDEERQRERPLRTHAAFDAAYRHLLNLLRL